MAEMTIEEAAAQLDEAVRAVRRQPWGGSTPETTKVLADYEAKKRAALMAVLEDAFDHRYVTPTAGSEEHRLTLRARIAALGGKDGA